jgi:hypothetical protein
MLLDHGGSDGLAYALWSLAVEEIGKGALLGVQVSGLSLDGNPVTVTISKDHDEKFTEGLRSMPGLQRHKFESLLRVTENCSRSTVTIDDPFKPGSSVAISSGTTGDFSDVSEEEPGVQATVALRFDLLYVGWHAGQQRFGRPGETIRIPELTGRWELNHADLLEALDAVATELVETTT